MSRASTEDLKNYIIDIALEEENDQSNEEWAAFRAKRRHLEYLIDGLVSLSKSYELRGHISFYEQRVKDAEKDNGQEFVSKSYIRERLDEFLAMDDHLHRNKFINELIDELEYE